MATYTSINDHRTASGDIDWKAYKAAQVASGENCYRCGGIAAILSPPGHRRLCLSCRAIDEDTDEVVHSDLLRCPKCRHQWNPYDGECYGVYEEGEHNVSCIECNHEFEVGTRISYSFTSPALLKDSDDDADGM